MSALGLSFFLLGSFLQKHRHFGLLGPFPAQAPNVGVFRFAPTLFRSDVSDGKIRAPCMIRGVGAAKSAPPWQDLRAMHSRTALCSAFRIHGAHILPMPAHFGYTAAICCQGGALFLSGVPSRMHEAKNLPLLDVGERIASIYRHSQAPENAFREHPAVAEQPRAHRERALPWHRPPWNALRTRIAVPGGPRTNCSRILPAKPHFQPRKSPGCSFLPRLTRAHPRDAAVPCCGDVRRRDGGVGAGRHWGAGLSAAERGIGAALSAR